MDAKFVKSLVAKMRKDDGLLYASIAIFGIAALYIIYNGQINTILLAIGVALILYSLTNDINTALIAGALAGLIAVYYSRNKKEGFEDVAEEEEKTEGFEEEEEVEEKPKKAKKAKKAAEPPPDNGERGEFFQVGKKYKMPSENDDKEFHLDAGTTFMNAYKSLKPDQVAAMTKDTQELMNTQKQLMGTLQTLKPLIQDGKEMMNMFQSYFGSGQASMA
jgi:hypothetical protein